MATTPATPLLRETASFLLKSVRAEDIVCRFGGEEFLVILPVADLKVTQARAERIRSKLRELTVLHQGQSLGNGHCLRWRCGASRAMARLPKN